jgi:hypothetical protein
MAVPIGSTTENGAYTILRTTCRRANDVYLRSLVVVQTIIARHRDNVALEMPRRVDASVKLFSQSAITFRACCRLSVEKGLIE